MGKPGMRDEVFLDTAFAIALASMAAAVRLLSALERDPKVEIVPLSEHLCARAFELYRERPDKEWGLTDCVSFVVMQDRALGQALTTDEHFEQAGFRALLREQV
jgi:uncharacterized protein